MDKGNTAIVIEHDMDVIKTVDWIARPGPGGGAQGAEIVVAGTPEEVAAIRVSDTGGFLGGAMGMAAIGQALAIAP